MESLTVEEVPDQGEEDVISHIPVVFVDGRTASEYNQCLILQILVIFHQGGIISFHFTLLICSKHLEKLILSEMQTVRVIVTVSS